MITFLISCKLLFVKRRTTTAVQTLLHDVPVGMPDSASSRVEDNHAEFGSEMMNVVPDSSE